MFHPIDMTTWERTERYRHYMDTARCTYSLTAMVDIAALYRGAKERGLRLTPCLTYLSARAVNALPNLRFDRDAGGRVGWHDVSHPVYTVFHPESGLFSCLCTRYDPSFRRFYRAMTEDIERWRHSTALFPQGELPAGTHDFSSIPWLHYTEINLNLYTNGDHLPPIITVGRADWEGERLLLPATIQLHHAVADGWHASEYFRLLQQLADTAADWLDR